MRRRDFLSATPLAGLGMLLAKSGAAGANPVAAASRPAAATVRVISTWRHGVAANRAAMAVLDRGGSAVDAVEAGVMVSESDPEVTSVGYGGLPNARGVVELDAAIIDGRSLEAGAVAALQGIKNPIAVARKVMTETPHVLLVGDGALQFALAHGFEEEDLLTDGALDRWQEWRRERRALSPSEDHDTIGMVAIDDSGAMAAACTTSGLGFKLPGRVGDSPLIGHGLYCDGAIGGAAATGVGEEVIKVAGSYQVVENMRQGMEPQRAVEEVIGRVVRRDPANLERMVGFVALRRDGVIGFASTMAGFQAAVTIGRETELRDGTVFPVRSTR